MKVFLYITAVLIIGFSFSSVKAGSAFPFVLFFCVMPIAVASYLYGIVWAYLFSVVFSAFCIGLIKLGVAPSAVFVAVINFNLAPLVVLKVNNMLKGCRQDNKNSISQAEQSYQGLLKQDSAIKDFNARLEKDVLEMARLYEITKAMSASLEFSGIFAVLKNILQKAFVFKTAKLLIFSQDPNTGEAFVDKAYRISPREAAGSLQEKKIMRMAAASASFLGGLEESAPEDTGAVEPATGLDKALAGFYSSGQRQSLIFKRGQEGPFPKGLALEEGVLSFAATGFFHEDKPSAILSIENLLEEQTDRFLIVASQFGLQMEKAKLYAMVQQLAIIDGLTGIFVRRYLLERCQEELRRSLKHKLILSCLIVDIDFFKDCNDKYGHLVGDVVLKQIADLIKTNIREVDFVGRLGGEEFCVILPDTPAEGAVHVGERVRSAIQQHTFEAYDEKVKVTVSIGAAVFPDDASDLNQLIDRADSAMYKAKTEGRNKVCRYVP